MDGGGAQLLKPKGCVGGERQSRLVAEVLTGTQSAGLAWMNEISPRLSRPLALVPLALSLSGCRVIGGIFKAGVGVGVIAVLVIIALLYWGIRSVSR
jgi:hypothetical protein